MTPKLDKYDEIIICELDNDSRTPISIIAKKMHLSKETIKYRIRRLLKNGYIKYFNSVINASNVGYSYCWILLKFERASTEVRKQILDYILHKNNIANIRILEGPYDMAFLFIHKNFLDITQFLTEFTKSYGQHILDKQVLTILKSHKFRFVKIHPESMERILLEHTTIQNHNLKPIDKKILKILSSDARIQILELARKIHADPGTIRYRIRSMEKNGIIAGYSLVLDLEKYRSEYHQINITLRNYEALNRILSYFDSTKSSIYAYQSLGKYDLSIDLYVKDIYELRRILENFKEKFSKDTIAYEISHIIQESKINWSPFD